MIFDISGILKTDGGELPIEINQLMEGLNAIADDLSFESPVKFKGSILNSGGVLKLKGKLSTLYKTKCSRCLNDVEAEINTDIKEDFFEEGKGEEEAYTYRGKYVELEKVFKDNIILNLPAKQVCRKECRGLCPYCGANLNEETCNCKNEEIDLRLEALGDFFKNQENN